MEVIIKGTDEEIAELLAATIRHNEKEVFNFGGITVKDPVEFKKFLEVLRERLNQADAYNLVGE
ncbi:MAG: hypothetical protein IJS29_08900 [Selenomonadaceae bacterium]|nr:hypothetical protein [Selenomonadaceae bacterium]